MHGERKMEVRKKKQKIFHLRVLGVGEQAGSACRGTVAFGATGITGILFQLCPVGAWVWHRVRSGRGNVREEEPHQKQGLFYVFLPQTPCSEGRVVGVGISDTVSWKITVLEVIQLQTR